MGAGTKAASATDYTFTVTAKQNSNYTGSITKSYKIDPLKVTIEGLSVYDKEYDGNTSASIKGTETLKTAANGSPYASDSVSVKRGTASFEDKNAGTDKKVTFNGFELEGADAGNYYLESQPEAVKATISKKALKVSGIIAKDKTYDTKADVELEISSATLSGVIAGETITIKSAHGAFSDENAGTDKTVNIDSIVLEGLTVGNYEFASDSQKTATATIDKASHDLIRMPGIEINTAGLTGEKAIDINLYLVPDVTLIKADIDSNINSYIIPVSNSSNIYKYKCDDSFASSQDGVSGYITYTVTSKNYADYNILLYVTLKNKSADVVLDTSSAAGSNVTEALGASESLKDLAASQDEEKVNTEVKLKVKSDDEVKNDDAVGAADLTKCINEECSGIAANNLKTDNVDISIFKTYKDSGSNLQTTQITDTTKVIGISFKYNLFGRFNPKMFTLHGSVAKQLKRLMTKPDEDELQNCEGCFFVEDNGKDSIFTIYSSEYSVFTVVTSTVPVYEVKLDDTLGKVTSIEISQNNKIAKPADPVKDGYTFDGWFDASGKAWNFNDLVTKTVVLTARFTKKATSTVVVQPADSSETTQRSSENASDTVKPEETPAQSTVTQAKATTSNASNISKNKGTVTDTKTETKTEAKEEPVVEPAVVDTTETVETVEEIKEEVTDTKEVTKESEPAKEPEIAEPEKEKKFPGGLLAGVLGAVAVLGAAAYITLKKRA